jgi:hypothetical protein
MDDRRVAPFSAEMVTSLNEFQAGTIWNPVRCGNTGCRRVLVATESGWRCPNCSYTQNWAEAWMADGTWRNALDILKREG